MKQNEPGASVAREAMSLNRRHKAGLLLILVATGLSLFLEASAKQTAGIALIGLAATWFFGSVGPRTLGLILCSMACCVGLYLAVVPIWKDWESYQTAAQEYDSAIGAIREAAAKAGLWDIVPPDKNAAPKYTDLPRGARVVPHSERVVEIHVRAQSRLGDV